MPLLRRRRLGRGLLAVALGVALAAPGCKLDASGVGAAATDGGQALPDVGAICPDTTVGATSLAAFAAAPKTIDGDLKDWGCETALSFPSSPSGVDVFEVSPSSLARVTASVRLEWDASALYVGGVVVDAGSIVADAPEPEGDDAFEIDLTSQATLAGTWQPGDHRVVVDVAGRTKDYGPSPAAAPGDYEAAVKRVSDGPPATWSFEVKLPARLVGKALFAAGDALHLDLQLDDAIAPTTPAAFHVWTWKRLDASSCNGCTCCCGSSTSTSTLDFPNCDTFLFGDVTLK